MAKLIVYLLEASVILTLFYLLYLLVLRRETFFNVNRFFLLGIVVVSLLFPLLRFDFTPARAVAVERPIEQISKIRMSYYDALSLWEFESYANARQGPVSKPTASNSNWHKYSFTTLFILYVIGIVVCLSRTYWTLRWIWKMISVYPKKEMDGAKIIKVPNPIAPFSFLNYVFVHDAMVDTPEFDQILAHEKTHIQQRHSIDLIFVQLLAAFFWFNPVIWRLIKSLKTTHEYIADKTIINSGYSLVEYQTLLLKQLISNNSFGLVHNFNLSFIKKRITMMKSKKSGWSGKVKVALAIASTVLCSAIIIQCNSKIDEQVSVKSGVASTDEFAQGINLPVLPETGYTFEGNLTDALDFTIVGNKLTINGVSHELDEIAYVIANGGIPTVAGHIILRIDKDQTMGFVRNVQTELRKADRRKILYLAQTNEGTKVESVILLPPTPDNAAKNGIPLQPDISEIEANGTLDVLKVDLGNNEEAFNQQKVYDFVKSHIQKQSTDYVVGARFDDEDTYQDYLKNLAYVKEGFHQIYQERAHALFGKDYFDLDKEEFKAVRQGVPMAISISEKDTHE
jgi:BlaR1 peptidase M56